MATPEALFDPHEALLPDSDAWDLPRRLTRRDGALTAGPDWIWTRPQFEADDTDD